jgi:hypothetical protein
MEGHGDDGFDIEERYVEGEKERDCALLVPPKLRVERTTARESSSQRAKTRKLA